VLRVGVLVLATLLSGVGARADESTINDPDLEIAQRYFREGTAFYDAADYEHALERFTAAQRVRPLPEMEYDIARCHDRMDHPALAIAAYERFLASQQGEEHAEVRARIEVLRARVAPSPSIIAATAPPPQKRSRRAYLAPGLVAGLTLALGVTGTALWFAGTPSYNSLQSSWLAQGSTPSVQDRARSQQSQEYAAYALWGIAGAAAIADVVLWALLARHHHESLRAASAPSASGWVWTF
jgi:tetratricopeptide (TPR) repeat protein